MKACSGCTVVTAAIVALLSLVRQTAANAAQDNACVADKDTQQVRAAHDDLNPASAAVCAQLVSCVQPGTCTSSCILLSNQLPPFWALSDNKV